jgi:DNA-binding HxlR family transcriptional regulator
MDTVNSTDADRRQRHGAYDCSDGCPVEAALELIGGKWKGVALYHLMSGAIRFNALKRQMGDVTQRMLTKQLRELEADGLVQRKVYPVVPPKVEYSLTETGWSLKPVLEQLSDWGKEFKKRRDSLAGTPELAETRELESAPV